MAFTDILRKIFPAISVFSGLGGPFGVMAATAIGKALGVDKVDPSKVTDVVTQAMSDPTKMAALQQAEDDLQLQRDKMGFENIEAMESLAVQDRESARSREIAVHDYTPEIGFYLLIVVFMYMLHYLFRYPIPQENRALIFTLAGSIGTLLVTAATYFYGTTRGAESRSSAVATAANAVVSNGKK